MATIVQACAQAYAHMDTHTLADATAEDIRACMQRPEVKRVEERLQKICLSGDVEGTKRCLQALNKAYKAALAVQRQDPNPNEAKG